MLIETLTNQLLRQDRFIIRVILDKTIVPRLNGALWLRQIPRVELVSILEIAIPFFIIFDVFHVTPLFAIIFCKGALQAINLDLDV